MGGDKDLIGDNEDERAVDGLAFTLEFLEIISETEMKRIHYSTWKLSRDL